MPNTPRILLPILLCAAAARGDLVSSALVRYGDGTFTTDQHFGTVAATAGLGYSGPGSFQGAAAAGAGYGLLSAAASVEAAPAAYGVNLAHAEASFSDVLTVSGAAGAGYIVYTYTVTGEASGEALAALFVRHQGGPDEEMDDEIAEPGELMSSPHPFTFDQPFSFGAVLLASASIDLGETGAAAADFSLGAALTGIEIFDARMRPIGAFELSSLSGTEYPVPGPGMAVMVMAGLSWSAQRRGRRTLQ